MLKTVMINIKKSTAFTWNFSFKFTEREDA